LPQAAILVVDDEPSICTTLSAVLEREGYSVVTAATVSEALREIGQRNFNVLIADLNVGEQGDGFTVVSAMRRTQPDCVTYILTGYPAFESALEAIRRQVDDYLVKPADLQQLLASIAERLKEPRAARPRLLLRPLATLLREKVDEIVSRTTALMREDPLLRELGLADEERVGHVRGVIEALITQLESTTPGTDDAIMAAAVHGRVRREQGYSLDMLVEDARILDDAIHDVIEANLLDLKLSNLISDLRRINDSIGRGLQASVRSYLANDASLGKPPSRAGSVMEQSKKLVQESPRGG
jgi:ActR/RegA family two-component response regulator